ncbi:MAG: N-acetylmuramoyl-L-alanine amidase family protein [Anaerolineae bacterium]
MTIFRLCLVLVFSVALTACSQTRARTTPEPAEILAATPLPSATRTAMGQPAAPATTPSPSPSAAPLDLPVVVIDPGHGGIDVGAPHIDDDGNVDFTESQVNLALALRIRDILKDRPVRVVLTRDTDSLLNEQGADVNGDGDLSPLDDLQLRIDIANVVEADLFLSIHQNAFYWSDGSPAPDVGGTVTFYCADRPFADESLRFATLVHENIVQALADVGYDTFDREVQDDLVLDEPDEPGSHLIVLGPESDRIVRPSQAPGALSESSFITSAEEAALMRNPKVLDKLAMAYADAIVAYFQTAEGAEDR